MKRRCNRNSGFAPNHSSSQNSNSRRRGRDVPRLTIYSKQHLNWQLPAIRVPANSIPKEFVILKSPSMILLAAIIIPVSAILFSSMPISKAQQPASSPSAAAITYPAPTNLKVLPKGLTGDQVRDIMEGWESELGTACSTCHVRNPNDLGPNGRPRFNYADDSKEEKRTARVMYAMVDSINTNFVSKVPNSGVAVSCGTCHRGHLSPEPYNGGDASKPALPSAPATTH